MRFAKRFNLIWLLPFVLLSQTLSVGLGGLVWDEFSAQGDLSGSNTAPTSLTFVGGPNTVRGSTISSPIDRDFFKITIGPGQTLDTVILRAYTPATSPTTQRSFFAVGFGSTIASISSASPDVNGNLIRQSDVNTDVLDNLGLAGQTGNGFTGPLGPGDYTFWFQETAVNINNYEFEFNISPVPEPSSLMLLAVGLIASGNVFGRNRKKR